MIRLRAGLRALLAVVSLGTFACDVSLESGVYACEEGGCPPAMVCDRDGLCRDRDAPGLYYDPCTATSDCREGSCILNGAAEVGICSESCDSTGGDPCPAGRGQPALCAVGMGTSGACGNGCTDDSDCGTGLDCLHVPRTMGEQACYPLQPPWREAAACTQLQSGMPCASPEECMVASGQTGGMCALPCGQPNDACPSDKVCVELSGLLQPFTRSACIRRCTSPSDCGDATLSCVERAPGESYCLPAGLTY